MNEIKPAKSSPRIENSVLKWYHGDAFEIEWEVRLTQDNIPYEFDENDELIFSFYKNPSKVLVHQFTFTNIQDYTVVLGFTEEISKKFDIGQYSYCVKFNSHDGELVTLFAKERAEVEKCH